jgi:alpha-ketoglutarate-dependent taurine dioxygenase
MSATIEEAILDNKRAPLFITWKAGDPHLHEFVELNRPSLLSKLTEHGAILFRGFDIHDAYQFSEFITATGSRSIDYTFRSTPRKVVNGQIYTSTEYPANREIPLHNENSYHNAWPYRLAFLCLVPATLGGETPIADMRGVVRSLGPALMDRFEESKVQYLRHFHPGIDLPWTDVFQTTDPLEVARFCDANSIRYDWVGANGMILRTIQTCQGVAHHPITSERLFFNQAHLFHATSMGQRVASVLYETFGPGRLPRHAKYGNDTEISDWDISIIQTAFKLNETTFSWQAGDLLWIDNMQVAHGRRPFTGERKLLAALMDSSNGR